MSGNGSHDTGKFGIVESLDYANGRECLDCAMPWGTAVQLHYEKRANCLLLRP